LKLFIAKKNGKTALVAPHAGAWIETDVLCAAGGD
jgi:hypothetical protein